MKLIKTLLISATVILAGCGADIDVKVSKSTGGPVSSMTVTVSGEGKTYTGSTNLNGKASFNDLKYGTYTVSTAATTSYSAATTSVDLTLFGGDENVNMTVGVQ